MGGVSKVRDSRAHTFWSVGSCRRHCTSCKYEPAYYAEGGATISQGSFCVSPSRLRVSNGVVTPLLVCSQRICRLLRFKPVDTLDDAGNYPAGSLSKVH